MTDPVAGFPPSGDDAADAAEARPSVPLTRGGKLHNLRAIPIFARRGGVFQRISIASGFGWMRALSLRALKPSRRT